MKDFGFESKEGGCIPGDHRIPDAYNTMNVIGPRFLLRSLVPDPSDKSLARSVRQTHRTTTNGPITYEGRRWKFNDAIALEFDSHARAHIPHYEEVVQNAS